MPPAADVSAAARASWPTRLWRSGGASLARYADWLGGLSWKRFFLIAVLALLVAGLLSEMPPFNLPLTPDRTEVRPPRRSVQVTDDADRAYEINIDERGVRIAPRGAEPSASAAVRAAEQAASKAARAAQRSAEAAAERATRDVPPVPPAPPVPPLPSVDIRLPPGAAGDEVREAIEEAKAELQEALKDIGASRTVVVPGLRPGEALFELLLLLVVASILVKVMGTGRRKAEARAAVATEMAEGEALKRQVVEARMAAMQAQVEPHFLFNTLASIDHLIETDAARASRMQKNLIALLRASMPTMRETAASGAPRHLERELAVVRPYLEILKMRMEERLAVTIDVPDGLLSADFPPMVMQSLVENAVKHGLEPKPDGGTLHVKAEIVHGKLQVSVADTGLGFGKAAATGGTGVGLANIRERLKLLYGDKAALTISENRPGGTRVTVTVPYVAHTKEAT